MCVLGFIQQPFSVLLLLLGRKTGEDEFEYLSMGLGGRESTKILRDWKNVQAVCTEYLECCAECSVLRYSQFAFICSVAQLGPSYGMISF